MDWPSHGLVCLRAFLAVGWDGYVLGSSWAGLVWPWAELDMGGAGLGIDWAGNEQAMGSSGHGLGFPWARLAMGWSGQCLSWFGHRLGWARWPWAWQEGHDLGWRWADLAMGLVDRRLGWSWAGMAMACSGLRGSGMTMCWAAHELAMAMGWAGRGLVSVGMAKGLTGHGLLWAGLDCPWACLAVVG
jgi:hypothetical protein